MIKNCKTKGCNNKVEEMKYCIDCAWVTWIDQQQKKLLALGKDPKFVGMLGNGAVKPKRMF